MESALLSPSRFAPLHYKGVCGLGNPSQSFIHGGSMSVNQFMRTSSDFKTQNRGRQFFLLIHYTKIYYLITLLTHFVIWVSSWQFGRKVKKTTLPTVIPDPDYRIPIVLLGFAGGLGYADNLLAAAPVGLLGLLLLFQTTRVRFVFDNEALEVKVGEQLDESGENVFVGGKNRWKYSSFVNWELWWPNFPILVYFKEKQTKPEGQIHFFPVIFNGKQLYDVMVERAGPSKTSGPKQS